MLSFIRTAIRLYGRPIRAVSARASPYVTDDKKKKRRPPFVTEDFFVLLQNLHWGKRPTRDGDNFNARFTDFEALGEKQLWSGIEYQDFFLPPYRSASKNKLAAGPSATSQKIEEGKLLGVGKDEEWMENALAKAKSLYPGGLMRDLPGWVELRKALEVAEFYTNFNKIVREENEAATDNRTIKEIEHLNKIILALGDEFSRGLTVAIEAVAQQAASLGHRVVHPNIGMVDMDTEIEAARFENKSVLVQFAYSGKLEEFSGRVVDETWKDTGVTGIYNQAHVPSLSPSRSSVVRIGNPALYRWAYSDSSVLYVSSWRSIDPDQANRFLKAHLPTFPTVVQGHTVLESLALVIIGKLVDGGIQSWLRTRHNSKQRIPPQKALTARMMALGADYCKIISDLFLLRGSPTTLILGTTKVTGIVTTHDKALQTHLKRNKAFPLCLKEGTVWRDDEWVVKVASPGEKNAMLGVAGSRGVVELTGSMEITVGPHKGVTLLFTRHVGTSVEDLDSDNIASTVVMRALKDMHQKGWHHHDIHPGNVVKNGLGNYFVIDLSHAQPAGDCTGGTYCADTHYMDLSDEGTSHSEEETKEPRS